MEERLGTKLLLHSLLRLSQNFLISSDPNSQVVWQLLTEAVAMRCSVKKVFLESLQACNFVKKETLARVFSCKFGELSENTFSYVTPLMAASVLRQLYIHLPVIII